MVLPPPHGRLFLLMTTSPKLTLFSGVQARSNEHPDTKRAEAVVIEVEL